MGRVHLGHERRSNGLLDTVKSIRGNHPEPSKSFGGSAIPAKSSISAEPLQTILGANGEAKDGMFKAVFGRSVKMPCGCEAGKEMGVNTLGEGSQSCTANKQHQLI